MIIYLDESLIGALSPGSATRFAALGAIAVCCQHVREGTHILIASRSTYREIETYYQEMDPRTSATIRRYSDRLAQLKGVRDFVCRAARIVSDTVTSVPIRRTNGGIEEILIPIGVLIGNSGLLSRPILMVENVRDGQVYLKLVESIVSSGLYDELSALDNIPLRAEIAPGGGNTISQLYDYHKIDGNRIGVAIADGDFRYIGSQPGDTAKALLKSHEQAPRSPFLEVGVLTVRTIENCIPRNEIRKIAREIDVAQGHAADRVTRLFSESPFWVYLPVKAGVRCFELGQTTAESIFWTNLFGSRVCDSTQACPKKESCKKFVMPSLTSQIIPTIAQLNRLLEVTSDCARAVAETWKWLVRLLFSFFCGSERQPLL